MIFRLSSPVIFLLLVICTLSYSDSIASAKQDCHGDCYQQRQACRRSCPDGSCWSQCQSDYDACLAGCAERSVTSAVAVENTSIAVGADACTDECQADLQAQRYACGHSGLTPQQAIQCLRDANAAYQTCISHCGEQRAGMIR